MPTACPITRWKIGPAVVTPVKALLVATLAAVILPCGALAQTYPSKPIRLLVPFAPGRTTDVIARLVGQKLSEALGQQILIDNRPGANGNLGTEIAVKSSADGYTLVMS